MGKVAGYAHVCEKLCETFVVENVVECLDSLSCASFGHKSSTYLAVIFSLSYYLARIGSFHPLTLNY